MILAARSASTRILRKPRASGDDPVVAVTLVGA